MLLDFLKTHKDEILALTEEKTRELAGAHPSSKQLEEGLPNFFRQLIGVIQNDGKPASPPPKDIAAIAKAADDCNEPAMAEAAGQPEEADLARTAGDHGAELARLGYTLSHVVHAYGAMCQSITQIASANDILFDNDEFHALNRCLDVAIAGAVTQFQSFRNSQQKNEEFKPAGFLTHEMRSVLSSAIVAFQMLQKGTVGVGGSTGQVLHTSLTHLQILMDKALEEQGDAH